MQLCGEILRCYCCAAVQRSSLNSSTVSGKFSLGPHGISESKVVYNKQERSALFYLKRDDCVVNLGILLVCCKKGWRNFSKLDAMEIL